MTLTTPDRQTFTIGPEGEGQRLDKYLVQMIPAWSRSAISHLIRNGNILVNDAVPKKPGHALTKGDTVIVSGTPSTNETPALVPEKIALDVLYEDDEMLAIDKAAGIAVHPGPGHASGTLANALLARGGSLSRVGGANRPGIVHRLDMDTSGIILIAKTDDAHRSLATQLMERTMTKVYIVLVRGRLDPEEAIIEAPIARDPEHRQRMAVVEGGREASTEYRMLANLKRYTLVEARPHTGRPHQIRVHFASIRHPVAGDRIYAKGRFDPVPRLFLHANRLVFQHPRTGEPMDLVSPLAEDLAEALRALAEGTPRADLINRLVGDGADRIGELTPRRIDSA